MTKKIKGSKRGLTFTSQELEVGQRYRYEVDISKKEVRIIPVNDGDMIVSRKKSGNHFIPLVDIRSSSVKKVISTADYLCLEVLPSGDILVSVVKERKTQKSKLVSIRDIISRRNVKQFIIPEEMLAVSGESGYPQYLFGRPTLAEDSYFDYLYSNVGRKRAPSSREVKKIYDVISLFSGAGMLDRAFLDGRFRFVYGIDFEPAAVRTYRENIGNHIVCGDIRDVDAVTVPDADVAIGGPCCQAYSGENRHNADSVEGEAKRLLIDDYCRIVKEKNVKVWVIENVPELLTKSQGYYLNRICERLSDYEITATVIADDEVGGYSVRRRAIVIGSKVGRIDFPETRLAMYKTVRDALQAVNAEWYNYEDVTKPKPETQKKMSFVPQGGNWKDVPAEINTYGPDTHSCIMRRLEWNKPSITLTNFRKSNILHPEENRILSVAEAAAIMGLDKNFKFLGTLSEKQQMVANGVTQAIGRFVKKLVLNALDNEKNSFCPA